MARCLLLFAVALASFAAAPPAQQLRALLDRVRAADSDRWPDWSEEKLQAIAAGDRALLAELRRIPRAALPFDDRADFDAVERELLHRLDQWELGLHLTPWFDDGRYRLAPLTFGRWLMADVGAPQGYATAAAAERALERLESAPAGIERAAAALRRAMKDGTLPPRSAVRGSLYAFATVAMTRCCSPTPDVAFTPSRTPSPQTSMLFRPFRAMTGVPAEDRARLQARAEEAIAKLLPAARAYWTLLAGEFLQACPESDGLARLPRGAAIYRALARRATGAEVDPEKLHRLGLAEVARIRGEMIALARSLGHEEPLDRFLAAAYADANQYYRTENELLDAYRAALARVQPLLGRVAGRQPTIELKVEPVRHGGAAAMYNTDRAAIQVEVSCLDLRPKFEVMALALHEGIPGHHLERTLSRRLPEDVARSMYHGAFMEGWALYAEALGEELGLYRDPYERLGRLGMELMRAVRIVTDTGIHALGWSAAQARQYFIDQTGKSAAMAELEVGRSQWPAAQLAYKYGEWRIHAMRRRASQALGDRLRLAAFHDALVRWSPLPMDVMERRLDECLSEPSCAAQLR